MSDNRARQRRRTRLRSGKIADLAGGFISDCAVHDRSPEGARLRLACAVAIPDRILVYEDEEDTLSAAAIVWRRDREIGIRFTPETQPPHAEEARHKLAGKYYAV